MKTPNFKPGALALALAGSTLCAPAIAADNEWTFALTPYLWLPNINGSLKYDLPNIDPSPDVETGPNNYLENLDFAFMISGEARKGKWSIFADAIYLDFAAENSRIKSFGGAVINATIDLETESSLSGGVWTLAGGYSLVQDSKATLDLIGGFRYLGIEASTDWSLSTTIIDPDTGDVLAASGSISEDGNLWDGIIGVRGHVKLGDSNWAIPYYADIGTGDSKLTWQAMTGITYNWNWGGVSLVYRHLSYDMDDDKLLQDVEFSGPALGATFRF